MYPYVTMNVESYGNIKFQIHANPNAFWLTKY